MQGVKHKRKITAVPVVPRSFAEDRYCENPYSASVSNSSSTDFSSPSGKQVLRVDELEFTTIAKKGKLGHAQGSVFHLAKKLGSGGDTTDDSSVVSEGVEVIISELESGTQISDASDSSTIKDYYSSSDSSSSIECSDFHAAIRSVLEKNRQVTEQRTSERKSLFAKVLQQIDTAKTNPKARVRAAVIALVTDVTVRQEFLRKLDVSSDDSVFLMRTDGRIRGLYTLERKVLFKLFGLKNEDSAIAETRVKRWLRMEKEELVPTVGGRAGEAVAFDC